MGLYWEVEDLFADLDLFVGGAGYPETGASAIETAESTKTAKKLC